MNWRVSNCSLSRLSLALSGPHRALYLFPSPLTPTQPVDLLFPFFSFFFLFFFSLDHHLSSSFSFACCRNHIYPAVSTPPLQLENPYTPHPTRTNDFQSLAPIDQPKEETKIFAGRNASGKR
jgi:hypothetical protein